MGPARPHKQSVIAQSLWSASIGALSPMGTFLPCFHMLQEGTEQKDSWLGLLLSHCLSPPLPSTFTSPSRLLTGLSEPQTCAPGFLLTLSSEKLFLGSSHGPASSRLFHLPSFFVVGTESQIVTQYDLELLPQLPKCQDYRCGFSMSVFFNFKSSIHLGV